MTIEIAKAASHNTKTLDEENARAIDDMLTYIALCERTPGTPEVAAFDGAFLIASQRDFDSYAVRGLTSRQLTKFAATLSRWDGAFACVSDRRHTDGTVYELVRVRDVAGRSPALSASADPPGTRTHELATYDIRFDGVMELLWRCHFYRAGGRVGIPEGSEAAGESLFVNDIVAKVIHNLYRADTTWSVRFRVAPGTPSVAFYTDPTGVKEFLKFRDKDPGTGRREALSHWVTDHWRRHRADPDVEVYVREHVRGRTSCTWHGMEARVRVPDADVVREEVAAAARKRLSATQLARRVKQMRRR